VRRSREYGSVCPGAIRLFARPRGLGHNHDAALRRVGRRPARESRPAPPATQYSRYTTPPCLSICRISHFMHSHAPLKLIAITRSEFSSMHSATLALPLQSAWQCARHPLGYVPPPKTSSRTCAQTSSRSPCRSRPLRSSPLHSDSSRQSSEPNRESTDPG
jgi:hypothetical protein